MREKKNESENCVTITLETTELALGLLADEYVTEVVLNPEPPTPLPKQE